MFKILDLWYFNTNIAKFYKDVLKLYAKTMCQNHPIVKKGLPSTESHEFHKLQKLPFFERFYTLYSACLMPLVIMNYTINLHVSPNEHAEKDVKLLHCNW